MIPELESHPAKDFRVRDEKIERLERLMDALSQAAARQPAVKDKILAGVAAALTSECPSCRLRIEGAALLSLAGLPDNGESSGIKRLRSGRCATEKCHSKYYRLHFREHPDVDWPGLFAKPEEAAEVAEAVVETEPARPIDHAALRKRRIIRLSIVFGILLLALWLRQVYFGGRIPVLREPEKFRVDPLPSEKSAR